MSTTAPLLRLRDLRREFPAGDEVIAVLRDVNLDIHAGEMVAIVGQSGSGKSTLMNILGCLDRPTRGSYQVAGRETGRMQPDELAELRREHFGFIFQRYHLLGDLDARGNVEVPAVYAGSPVPCATRVPSNCCSAWAWVIACITSRASCPVASSSACRSRVP